MSTYNPRAQARVAPEELIECACGSVALELEGGPIACVACHCVSCQQVAQQIEALPGSRALLDSAGGTAYVLYRKGQVTWLRGGRFLRSYRARPNSKARRIVATCCNSALLVQFDDTRQWVPVFDQRFVASPLPVQMRVFRKQGDDLGDGIPSYATIPLRLRLKLAAVQLARK